MKYRKKPLIIHAEQFFGGQIPDAFKPHMYRMGSNFMIKTLEGHMHVHHGDWLVLGIKGEPYAIKDDIFKLTYERVEQDGE